MNSPIKPIEGYGFIARRVTTMGVHDYGHLWSFAPHEKAGLLKFRGAYQTRRQAREALMRYKETMEAA